MDQPVEKLMKTTMESIKGMIDVNTVVGDAIETAEGSVIVPISRVTFAFASGGGEMSKTITKDEGNNKESGEMPFTGGSGACVSVQPIGFLVTSENQIRMVPVHYNTAVERVVDMIPGFIETMEKWMNKRSNSQDEDLEQ